MNMNEQEWGDRRVIDLGAVLSKVWARRVWVAACVVSCATGFAIAAYLMTPVYRASTVLISASSDRSSMSGSLASAIGQLGGLASLAGVNVGASDAGTEEALAVLRSREFTNRFIADEKLLPELFLEANAGTRPPTTAQSFKLFNEKVRSVVQDKKTGLTILQVDWRDRSRAADWANLLVQKLNTEMRDRAIAKADASIGFLEKELSTTTEVSTRDAVSRLIESQVKQRMLANVTREFAFRVVDRAVAPDPGDVVKPRRVLMTAGGALAGLFLGIILVLVRDREGNVASRGLASAT